MLAHQTARRKSDQAISSTLRSTASVAAVGQVSASNRSSSAQAKGYAKFSGLSASRNSASLSSTSRSSSSTPSTPLLRLTPIIPTLVGLPQPAPALTDEERASQEEQAKKNDICTVRNALYQYKNEPLVPEDDELDLVRWWDVSGLTLPTCKMILLSLFCHRTTKSLTHFSFQSLWISFPYKHQQFRANESSHPAGRLVHYDAAFFRHQHWKSSRF